MSKELVNCPNCEKTFHKARSRQKFCSERCNRAFYRLPGNSSALHDWECEECGTPFRRRSSNQRFCSGDCRTTNVEKGTFAIFARDDFTCFWCGKSSFENKAELHLEHVFPLVAGGANRADNLVTSCVACNLEKHQRLTSNRIIGRVIREIERRNAESNISGNQKIKGRDPRPEATHKEN